MHPCMLICCCCCCCCCWAACCCCWPDNQRPVRCQPNVAKEGKIPPPSRCSIPHHVDLLHISAICSLQPSPRRDAAVAQCRPHSHTSPLSGFWMMSVRCSTQKLAAIDAATQYPPPQARQRKVFRKPLKPSSSLSLKPSLALNLACLYAV